MRRLLTVRDDAGTSWGLSRFSQRENGTVPFRNGEVIFELSLSRTVEASGESGFPESHGS